MDWRSLFEAEIEQAKLARVSGNEGKARVCARRAAGIVIGEYFRRTGEPAPSTSAYDRLRSLANMPGLPEGTRQAAERLLLRVTPEYQLPIEADLINDAAWLCETLIPEG
jgi:hypothetical protein